MKQNVSVPSWIQQDDKYKIPCLRGLLETDGCIYNDRGYPMVMVTSVIPQLAHDAFDMMTSLGFKPHTYSPTDNSGHGRRTRYRVRLSKRVTEFLDLVRPEKR